MKKADKGLCGHQRNGLIHWKKNLQQLVCGTQLTKGDSAQAAGAASPLHLQNSFFIKKFQSQLHLHVIGMCGDLTCGRWIDALYLVHGWTWLNKSLVSLEHPKFIQGDILQNFELLWSLNSEKYNRSIRGFTFPGIQRMCSLSSLANRAALWCMRLLACCV